jgi:hypothetical protein
MIDTSERRGIERAITGLLGELDSLEPQGAIPVAQELVLEAQTERVAARLDAAVEALRALR